MNYKEYSNLNITFSLAIILYFLFTFVMGFISISVGWTFNYVSEFIIVIIALLPLSFSFLHKYVNNITFSLIITEITWVITVFMPIIQVKYIFAIIGIFLSLCSFRLLISSFINLKDSNNTSAKYFIFFIVIIDQLIKTLNLGQIPIIYTSIFGKIAIVIFSIICFTIFIDNSRILKTNKDKMIHEFPKSVVKSGGLYINVIAFYFLLFLYFFLFSNNGPISYALNGEFTNLLFLFPIAIISLLFLYFLAKDYLRSKLNDTLIIIILSIMIIYSSLNYPWFNPLLIILWIGGLLSLVILLDYSLNFVSNSELSNSNRITTIISFSYLLMVLILFIILMLDLFILFAIIAGFISIISIKTSLKKKHKPNSINGKEIISIPNLRLIKITKLLSNGKKIINFVILTIIITLGSLTVMLPITGSLPEPQDPDSVINVMTFNIHFGINSEGYDNIDQIANFIASESPSMIGLQEISFSTPLNGYKNMFGSLKNQLNIVGYEYSYFSKDQTGFLANAFFSKYPIINASTVTLEPKALYQRNMLNMVLDIEGSMIRVINLHLTHVIEDRSNPDRVLQVKMILNEIKQSTIPVIIMGDFNSYPEFEELKLFSTLFQDAWNSTNPNQPGYTWPATNANQRIDYIFVDNSLNVTSCEVTETPISDHFPLNCDINI